MMRRRVSHWSNKILSTSSSSREFITVSSARLPHRYAINTSNLEYPIVLVNIRTQTSSSSNSSNNNSNSTTYDRESGIHTFIRNYQAQNARVPQPLSSSLSSSSMMNETKPGTTSSVSSSWATRLRKELYSEVDPLGGMAHKDYYRDPAKGFTPQYAPRNFGSVNNSDNGQIEYPHVSHGDDGDHYSNASAWRNWATHDVELFSRHAQSTRQVMRSIDHDTEREKFANEHSVPLSSLTTHVSEGTASRAVQDLITHNTVTSGQKVKQQVVLSRYDVAQDLPHSTATSLPSSSSSSEEELEEYENKRNGINRIQNSPVSLADTLPAEALADRFIEQFKTIEENKLAEELYKAHGLREKERYEFNILQRTSRLPFEGYDMDRFRAQQRGTPYGAIQLAPLSSPSSIAEAQQNLREHALPEAEQIAQRDFAANTVVEEPQLGEGLTQHIVQHMRSAQNVHDQEVEKLRSEKFGLGRHGLLVQDSGPDRREVKKHTNDEELVNALMFGLNAYRLTNTDEHINPYERNGTDYGVGHLIGNAFDLHRREDRVAHERFDLTERSSIHYGTPLQQIVDEYVLRHRNARGERPLDYFKPFPHFRAQRLNRMYQDTEGFSLIRSRPQMLEWELFIRYRAHHQQRRALALLHGLEPVANETASERNARRAALDVLCEETPFNPEFIQRQDDDMNIDVETLRGWVGLYLLPSPSVVRATLAIHGSVNAHLHHVVDEFDINDTREHVLSARYLNKILQYEAVQNRLGRLFIHDVSGKAPEPVIKYSQPAEVLKFFNTSERAMYDAYVAHETNRQLGEWQRLVHGRRFVNERNQYGEVCGSGHAIRVVDVIHTINGSRMTISVNRFAEELAPLLAENKLLKESTAKIGDDDDVSVGNITNKRSSITTSHNSNDNSNNNTNTSKATKDSSSSSFSSSPLSIVLNIDEAEYIVLPQSLRQVTPLAVRLECGEVMNMTDELFSTYALEVHASPLHNHALNYGIGSYDYNRGNYIETQDVLWERATSAGVEGWSPATHADGLLAGLPVRARRHLGTREPGVFEEITEKLTSLSKHTKEDKCKSEMHLDETSMTFGTRVVGGYERAQIVSYHKQPFFNPEPRMVTVEFAADKHIEQVPLSDMLIWQRQYYGPERTVGDASRRYSPQGARRYVDVADPNNEKHEKILSLAGKSDRTGKEHFLDKYLLNSGALNALRAEKFRSTKQVTELDQWTEFDLERADNYRPLSISHRRDYIRNGYFHRFTPWEWIAIQSGDQPLIADTIRSDNIGPSYYFSLNRYWRYKARPHGYIRHFEHEVRDLFQYVDGITPWRQAQKLRTYWEVRSHHPIPQFNRPEVAMHRNIPALLPTQLWDSDKKTGKVKGVKDSVRDYQTKTPFPKWVQL